jgi:hypothetical protein
VPIVPTTVHRTRTAIAKSSTAEYATTVTHTRIAAAHALKSGSRVTHASHIYFFCFFFHGSVFLGAGSSSHPFFLFFLFFVLRRHLAFSPGKVGDRDEGRGGVLVEPARLDAVRRE